MLKRLISVVCLSVLLLALASVATTSAAPQAGNFGLQVKPGFPEFPDIDPTIVAGLNMDNWFGRARTVQHLAQFNTARGGRTILSGAAIGSRTVFTDNHNNCVWGPYWYLNRQHFNIMAWPTGVHYLYTSTITDTAFATWVYTPVFTSTWPAVYSPTFDYRANADFWDICWKVSIP